MTREEAIKIFQRTKKILSIPNSGAERTIEALDMAIEALQAKTDGDTISRQEVVNIIRREVFWCDELIDKIKSLPSAETPTVSEKHQLSAETPTTDLISRADAIANAKYLVNRWIGVTGKAYEEKVPLIEEVFNAIPSADIPTKCIAQINIDADEVVQKIKGEYEIADRPSGEWEDKEVFSETNDDHIVDEWQSARCSICGKYHTTPYMYYFEEYKYCPNCGAKMGSDTR